MEARMKISFAQLLERGMTFTNVSDLLAGNRSLSTLSLSSEGQTELPKNNNESVSRHYLEGTISYSAVAKSLQFEDATGTLACTVASLEFTCYRSRRRYPYWNFIPPKPGGEALLEITCPSYFVREANAAIDKEPTKYNVITSDTFKQLASHRESYNLIGRVKATSDIFSNCFLMSIGDDETECEVTLEVSGVHLGWRWFMEPERDVIITDLISYSNPKAKGCRRGVLYTTSTSQLVIPSCSSYRILSVEEFRELYNYHEWGPECYIGDSDTETDTRVLAAHRAESLHGVRLTRFNLDGGVLELDECYELAITCLPTVQALKQLRVGCTLDVFSVHHKPSTANPKVRFYSCARTSWRIKSFSSTLCNPPLYQTVDLQTCWLAAVVQRRGLSVDEMHSLLTTHRTLHRSLYPKILPKSLDELLKHLSIKFAKGQRPQSLLAQFSSTSHRCCFSNAWPHVLSAADVKSELLPRMYATDSLYRRDADSYTPSSGCISSWLCDTISTDDTDRPWVLIGQLRCSKAIGRVNIVDQTGNVCCLVTNPPTEALADGNGSEARCLCDKLVNCVLDSALVIISKFTLVRETMITTLRNEFVEMYVHFFPRDVEVLMMESHRQRLRSTIDRELFLYAGHRSHLNVKPGGSDKGLSYDLHGYVADVENSKNNLATDNKSGQPRPVALLLSGNLLQLFDVIQPGFAYRLKVPTDMQSQISASKLAAVSADRRLLKLPPGVEISQMFCSHNIKTASLQDRSLWQQCLSLTNNARDVDKVHNVSEVADLKQDLVSVRGVIVHREFVTNTRSNVQSCTAYKHVLPGTCLKVILGNLSTETSTSTSNNNIVNENLCAKDKAATAEEHDIADENYVASDTRTVCTDYATFAADRSHKFEAKCHRAPMPEIVVYFGLDMLAYPLGLLTGSLVELRKTQRKKLAKDGTTFLVFLPISSYRVLRFNSSCKVGDGADKIETLADEILFGRRPHLFTRTGLIDKVTELTLTLSCSACHFIVSRGHRPHCTGHLKLKSKARFMFDDGTSVATVFCEDDTVYKLLRMSHKDLRTAMVQSDRQDIHLGWVCITHSRGPLDQDRRHATGVLEQSLVTLIDSSVILRRIKLTAKRFRFFLGRNERKFACIDDMKLCDFTKINLNIGPDSTATIETLVMPTLFVECCFIEEIRLADE